MESEIQASFRRSIEDNAPAVALMKYRAFIKTNKEEARRVVGAMGELALSSQLIGEYEMMHRDLDAPLDINLPQYRVIRDAMTKEANKLILEATQF